MGLGAASLVLTPEPPGRAAPPGVLSLLWARRCGVEMWACKGISFLGSATLSWSPQSEAPQKGKRVDQRRSREGRKVTQKEGLPGGLPVTPQSEGHRGRCSDLCVSKQRRLMFPLLSGRVKSGRCNGDLTISDFQAACTAAPPRALPPRLPPGAGRSLNHRTTWPSEC